MVVVVVAASSFEYQSGQEVDCGYLINAQADEVVTDIVDGTGKVIRSFTNVNVAAALSMAGNGPDNTTIEIWADPGVTRNTHTINVDSDATRFEMTIEGIPSPENPATGLLTPLSVLATLRGLVSTLKVGT